MSDHAWAVQLAIDSFEEDGRDVEIIYNRALDNSSDPTIFVERTTVKALNTEFNRNSVLNNIRVSPTIIDQITGQYLIDATCSIPPKAGMFLVDSFDDIEYVILAVSPTKPGEQLIFYRVFTGG